MPLSASVNKISSYFLRRITVMSELKKPVDEIIQNDLLPLIIGESTTENERQLFSLPARSGGLGISVFSKKPNMILITPFR